MPKELVISATPHETRVAILEEGQLCEIYIEREKEFALVGSIYKGRVTRVLPGMQSAFVEIGLDSDAFLYVGDFLENLEDYDHVVSPVENKIEKMTEQGGNVFAPPSMVEAAPAQPSAIDAAPSPQPLPNEQELSQQPPAEFAAGPSESAGQGSGVFDSAAAPPRYSATHSAPPAAPFGRQDRGPRGGGPGRGNDRGGRRRGRGWRGGRGRDRQPGRDLPPSKYASSSLRTFTAAPSRPYEPPTEEATTDYQMVVLPGESLAKYKDRAPEAAPPAVASGADASPSGLPASLYSMPEGIPAPAHLESSAPELPAATAEFAERSSISEPELMPAAEIPSESAASPDLSDEEVSVLSEQLAEARHEEASAEAEADVGTANLEEEEEEPSVPEGAAEAEEFLAEVDEQEHEDALAAEAEESADTQPSEALTDESEVAPPEIGEAAAPADQQPMSARVSEPNRTRFQRPMRRGGRQRGNRPFRQHDRRPPQPQRRPQLISEMLTAGQEIIVQIAKEPLGKKGARITSHVALPGRFLVYMPTVSHIGVSRRIASAEERQRLRRLVSEAKATFPGGFIVRTAAEGAPDDEIRGDVEFLGRTWEKIRAQGEPRKAPALLHRDLNLVERILRDYVSNDYTSIWIDNEEEYGKVVEFVGRFQPRLVNRVKLYTKAAPIYEEFGIQQELDKALRPKVWLKSGGYIVINHTEALVAIDVNTGKYVGRGSTRLEDTIVKTNLEAVKEIVRQIRLRDLGGIIILDFIDMEERRNRDKVMAALDSALRADRAPSKVLSFNEFGLVAVTRKRTKQALERVLCQPCPYCAGSGMVKSVPTICYEIQAEARKMSADLDSLSLTLRVHPEIAKALKTRESALIEELEQITRKSVIIQADPTLHWEQYDIY